VLDELTPVKPKILKEKINEHEKIILKIVEKDKKITSGDLYRKYCNLCEDPVSDRAFRDFIRHLSELKLIKVSKSQGSVRIISKA
jgi:Cdc6-like AAA superfamily ATPase